MMEAPVSKKYEGPSGIGRDSFWLTAEDLIEGTDAKVKIEAVLLYPEVTFQGGRKRLNMLGLKFVGKERVLGLNATNRKSLNAMLGNVTRAWPGNEIVLFVSETMMAGESVKCVRIRNRKSRVASAAEQFLADDDAPAATEPAGNGAEHATSGNGELGLGATPASGSTDPKILVTEACQNLGITVREQGMLYTKHGGDYAAMLAELKQRADDLAAKDEQESKVR